MSTQADKPSAIIEARSRAALAAAVSADPLALARMPAWVRELFAERLVVHEILVWLDEQAEERERARGVASVASVAEEASKT